MAKLFSPYTRDVARFTERMPHRRNRPRAARSTRPVSVSPSECFALCPEWLGTELAARLSGGVDVRTIRRWARLGYIRVARPAGGRLLVDRDSLRAFIEQSAR